MRLLPAKTTVSLANGCPFTMVKEVCHLLVDCGTVCSIERKTELDRSLNNRWVEESGTGSFGLA